MADSTSLSILRQTPLSSSIATKEWTEDNFLPLSAQVRQAWYGECGTAQSTKAKTVEIPGITELQTGLQLRIKFTEAQRASSPTLNVNSLGAHPIRRNGTTAVANYEWLAGEVIDLVFDGTAWIVSDGGIATTSYYGYTKLYNGATATSTAYALAPAALNSYSENTVVGAPALLTSSTYSVGDRVRYQFNTYECISDVQTPGAWASISSHFKELDPIQIQIDNLSDAVANIDVPEVEGKFVHLSGDTVSADFCLKAPDGKNALNGIASNGGKMAIGYNSSANGVPAMAVGYGAQATSTQATAVGYNSKAASGSTALGNITEATGTNAVALGAYSTATANKAIAIGKNTRATAENAIQIGNSTDNPLINNTANTLQIWDKPLLERTSGKIFVERIPELPISSVTNLQTTLDSKLSGVKMNGSNVTVTNGVANIGTVLTAHQSLDDYALKSTVNQLSNEVVEGLSNVVIPKLDTISGLVEEEVDRVDEISANLSNYSLTGHTHTSSDITDFPPIPIVNNGTLTIQKNGTLVQTFSANQSNSVTANISVPTKTSDLTNDSGFVVSSDLTKVMEYQGSVETYENLPISAEKGDVYNVISAHGDYPPGTNYAKGEDGWDPLGGSIDVSNFATKSQLTNYLPLSGGSMTGALSANNGFHADGYGGTTGLSIGNGENDEYYTHLIATTIKTQQSGGTAFLNNGYGYGLSVDAGWNSDLYGTYLNATKVKSDELFVNADMYGGGLSVGQGTDDIYGTYINATNLTAPGMIAGINNTTPHGGLSVTGIDFGDGSYLSSTNDFALASALNKLSSETVNGLSVVVNPKLSVIADKVEEEVAKLDELSGKLSGYALTSDIPLSVSELTNDAGYMTSYTETDPVFNNWLSGDKIYAGNEASATYLWDIAIGQSAKSAAGIAIGLSAAATGSSRTGIPAIAIGDQSVASSLRSTAIGFLTQASNAHSLALGSEAKALTSFAIQLGKGTNSEVSSLQVFDWQLLDSNGDIPYARLSASIPAAPDYEARISVLEESLSDAISVLQIINGESEDTGLEELIQDAVNGLSSQIPLSTSQLMNDSGYIKKTELQSDLSNYLPLSGGMISSNFALSVNDEYGTTHNFLSGVNGYSGNLAFGFRSSATGAGAEAIGTDTVAKGHESFAVGRGAQIQNEYNVDCVAVGFNAVVNAGSSYADGDHAIQLGYGTNTTPHTLQVFNHTLMDTVTGDIPYARLSSCGFRTILPIVSNNNLTVTLSSNVKTYRITDSSGNGTFPTLSAPTNISDFGDCYYAFEIEWLTNSTAASFPQQHDWINYPEIQSDGQQHTYYITGRYDSTNTEYTMNCWRVK